MVKLDESISISLAEFVRSYGYDVATVKDQGWGGLKDAVLWPRVVRESRFFVTTDKGFANIRKFPPGSHPGVLLLRPQLESIAGLRELLRSVFESTRLEMLAGAVAVADSRGLRVRRTRDEHKS